jgi:hypothetical protein
MEKLFLFIGSESVFWVQSTAVSTHTVISELITKQKNTDNKYRLPYANYVENVHQEFKIILFDGLTWSKRYCLI